MKKIFSIITIITALFLILSCGANLHNADVMHVDKVVVEGLTDLAGKEMVISGNWIPSKDGTANWVNGMGDTSNILDGAIATVGGDGTVVFKIDVITSEAELAFLGKVNEDAWSDANRFGAKAYANAGDAKVPNIFSGSDKPKIIYGKVGAGNVITWSIVDKIPESGDATTFVNLNKITFINMPAAHEGKTIGVVEAWVPGNDWSNYQPGFTATVTGGKAEFSFPAVKIETETLTIQSTVVSGADGIDWGAKVVPGVVCQINFTDAIAEIEVNFATIAAVQK